MPDLIELFNKVGVELDNDRFDQCCKAVGRSDTNMNVKSVLDGMKKLGLVQ